MREKISATLIVKNEEKNIARCLKSLSWVDEIIVVDSYSTDRTFEICNEFNCKVIQTAWLGFGKTKKFAVDNASHDWILSIDADEEVTPELQKKIKAILVEPKYKGYYIKRKSFYLGKEVKYCGWNKDYPVRLFNRNFGNFNDKEVHESIKIKSEKFKIHEPLLHYTYPTIASHIEKVNRYSSLAAEELIKKEKYYSVFSAVIFGIVRFIKMYFIQLGFLDGRIGFILCYNSAFSVYLKYVKNMPDKEIRILHIDNEKSWRGGQQQAFYLHQGLTEKDVFSLFICNSNSAIQNRLEEQKLPVKIVNMLGEIDLIAAYKISKICKIEKINIIQAHSGHALTIALLAKLFYRKVKLIGVRRVDFHIKKNFFSKWKYNSKLLNKIICVSEAIKNVLINDNIAGSKLLTIHDGIDINRFSNFQFSPDLKKSYNIPLENIVVGTVAAFVGHKDYPNLINAAKIVCNRINNVTFLALGDGELKTDMENLVSQLNINHKFIFAGFKNNVGGHLKIFNVFVMSSKLEGLGTSILDAQSVGLPIVATSAGGIPEIILDNKNGILVEPKNPQKLAEALIDLINDKNKQERLGFEAKVSVKKFSIENNIEQNIILYNQLLNEK